MCIDKFLLIGMCKLTKLNSLQGRTLARPTNTMAIAVKPRLGSFSTQLQSLTYKYVHVIRQTKHPDMLSSKS